MPRSYDVYFASSNRHKFTEAANILDSLGIRLGFFKCRLEEIQSDSLKEIATRKATHAFELCKKPVIVEDDGLYIKSLGGFPGPYSSYVFQTIGNSGILKLVTGNRCAQFISIISFCDKKNHISSFESKLDGKISTKIRGGGWGYDPIFIPESGNKTFAEIHNKNSLSHRYKSLQKFSRWFLNMQESTYR